MYKIIRVILTPFGLLKKLAEIANIGARDIQNNIRFKNVRIESNCCISKDTIIGSDVHILNDCIINNSNIDSYTYVGQNSIIQNANIGKFCSVANNVYIGLGNHPIHLISTSPVFYKRNNRIGISVIEKDLEVIEYKYIEIGNDVWIGSRATILDGVKIGSGSVIAANSVVTKDVPAYSIVAGVPATIIKFRFPENIQSELLKSNWWDKNFNEINEINNSIFAKKFNKL